MVTATALNRFQNRSAKGKVRVYCVLKHFSILRLFVFTAGVLWHTHDGYQLIKTLTNDTLIAKNSLFKCIFALIASGFSAVPGFDPS